VEIEEKVRGRHERPQFAGAPKLDRGALAVEDRVEPHPVEILLDEASPVWIGPV
jgi:hypothetical protein